ncbi:MAG: small subunit ribosomal protein S6 [Candidatus Magnetoglobus multicellularis str. Araruama]|uniref:Small ribosomal subunit protein bS6 n=1 Tax=Candidatus Magnetoglobus multicellularis str. Araruama TaxID=890399 RepID=A0A1V1PAN6_9BACT|nr:MAG: small subunit ribosomal protein S6 [Candidatus Magnetoglobus multicellularis str. Araruama]
MLRRYETILLFDIDSGEEAREAFITRSKSLIEQYEGELLEKDEWGVRKLAYEVRNKTRGFYVRLDYSAQTEVVAEYERIIRLEDSVMKYLTVMIDNSFDPDKFASQQAQASQTTEESIALSESQDLESTEAMDTEIPDIAIASETIEDDLIDDDNENAPKNEDADTDDSDDTDDTEKTTKEDS